MREILWFRRDLRISDNAILSHAKDEVLPIFIFDKDILEKLDEDDKRVTFIYHSVLKLKQSLQSIGLDLQIFHEKPIEVFKRLAQDGYDGVLCSIDNDSYSKNRDAEIAKIIPMRRYNDSFILNPYEHLKSDNTPYKVFTPFYKSLYPIWSSDSLTLFERNQSLKKVDSDYKTIPTLDSLGFKEQKLPEHLYKSGDELLDIFVLKIKEYEHNRDYINIDATSNLSTHLRFGLISPREVFNFVKVYERSEYFIRELFWREFYNYILFHFPYSEFENFNHKVIKWRDNKYDFEAWCNGETGVPIIDAAMRHLNNTGMMHNRLRMIVASFLTKNLLIDWRWGERYFSKKLLDYEASSNIGSWQWAASTGADAVPYFRIFNPITQAKKFDKENQFVNTVLKNYNIKKSIVDIKSSRARAIEAFKQKEFS